MRWRNAIFCAPLAVAVVIQACSSFSESSPPPATEAAEAGDGASGEGGDASSADAPTSCNANVSIDPKNCGACGHDCAGGACQAGRCQPVAVASSETDLEELRVAGDRLLYRANGSVRAVDVAGGLPSTLVPCADRSGLAVDDAGFYSWCNTSLTHRSVADAGVLGATVVDSHEVAAGGQWVFFREALTFLFRVPATLGDGQESQVTTDSSTFLSFAATSSTLFYMTGAGELFYAPVASGAGTMLEQGQSSPSAIAADDAAVFWATANDTSQAVLHTRALTAGASTALAGGLDHPDGLALDQTYVYLTARGTPPAYTDGAIVRVPRAGGPVETLAAGLLLPHEIAVTDRFVIWTSRGTSTDAGFTGGTIYRLAK